MSRSARFTRMEQTLIRLNSEITRLGSKLNPAALAGSGYGPSETVLPDQGGAPDRSGTEDGGGRERYDDAHRKAAGRKPDSAELEEYEGQRTNSADRHGIAADAPPFGQNAQWDIGGARRDRQLSTPRCPARGGAPTVAFA